MANFTKYKTEFRNPGCDYCVYFLSPSKAQRKKGGCLLNGRKVSKKNDGIKIYKWVNCEYPEIKNHRNYCSEFKMRNLFIGLIRSLFLNLAKHIFPEKNYAKAAFLNEEWWKKNNN